jgi:hypothetical protein
MSKKEKKPLIIDPMDLYPIEVVTDARRFSIDYEGGHEVEARFEPGGDDHSHVLVLEQGDGEDAAVVLDLDLAKLDRLIQLLMHAQSWLERKIEREEEKDEKATVKPAEPVKPAAPVFGFQKDPAPVTEVK